MIADPALGLHAITIVAIVYFIFDGIIILDIRIVGGLARNYIYIQKMRATRIDHGFRPLIFGKNGLETRTKESVSNRVKGFFGDEE